MKRSTLLWMFIAGALVCSWTPSSYAQTKVSGPLHAYTRTLPLHGGDNAAAAASVVPAAAQASVPLWAYTTTASRDGNTYSGMMVGRSPFFHGARTTNINTILVPVRITFQDTGTVFDPTVTDPSCLPSDSLTPTTLTQQSPLLMPANFSGDLAMNGVDEGSAQYVDAFQRAEFSDLISATGDSYHTVLNLLSTAPTISVSVGPGSGGTFETDFSCEPFGVMDVNAFDNLVTKTLLPNLASKGVGPSNFPIFLLYNVAMSSGPPSNDLGNCCILGYHSATGSLSKPQIYSVADYDSTETFEGTGDTSVMSHEIAELFNDPLTNNSTPSWGNVGQVQGGCQANLEVGDPLSGTLFPEVTMPNGITYDLQELAFYSWFFGTPSIGAGGVFSNNGTFTGDAGSVCQ